MTTRYTINSNNMSRKSARAIRLARKTIVTALPYNNKAVLLGVKAAFSLSWGFVNAICYFLTSRFFTMMTGNILILAVETLQWKTQEILFTSTLIIMFVFGGAVYDGISIWLKNEDRVVKSFVVPFCILLGVASDVIQFVMGSCSSGRSGDECTGSHLLFLAPMAILAGITTTYLANHPDGIATQFVTMHMKVPPNAALKRVMQGNQGVWEKALVSTMVIIFYFVGSLLGVLVSEHILTRYSNGLFTPIFTCFAFVMASLRLMHFTLCERFCYNYELENELIKKARANMIANGPNTRCTNICDVQRIMSMVVEKVDAEDDDDVERQGCG